MASSPSGAIDSGIVPIVLIFPFTRLVHVWNAPLTVSGGGFALPDLRSNPVAR
ncbi:respiratory nitrate reductase subunit gamma [Enterobacter asburiae]|uniref:respiratory nitrate reductase subunit gamma n=1 Tax=Enterobacter asburiae TaxID=61645 RepID=UPI00192A9239|nr:respiratory nitrate reductase subunit gamma [Enterobacter asburiae]MBL5958889.1 respiratory nitrate reductase subunit gamma [Enterobacter asburiae]